MLAAQGEPSAGSKEGAVTPRVTREWSEKEKEIGTKAFGRGLAG